VGSIVMVSNSDNNRSPDEPVAPGVTTVRWYGQAFFVIHSKTGAKFAFDPYATNENLAYSPPDVSADYVFVSHNHFDHNNVSLLSGNPKKIGPIEEEFKSGTAIVGDNKYTYTAVSTFHDTVKGKERGKNTVYKITVDDIRFCHLGDLGEPLTDDQIRQIGEVDVLFVPVGGYFTIDAKGAEKVVEQLKPKIVVPMHYKTDKVNLPIAGVDNFIDGKADKVRNFTDLVLKDKKDLPSEITIYVMKYRQGELPCQKNKK
ncbi:MAG TPA: MBL fold metallo-hydrolase, partial [Armatimonadota bacterium]|nr:MBL fold metallo-hydrolase [Armatimonadota bacterium]